VEPEDNLSHTAREVSPIAVGRIHAGKILSDLPDALADKVAECTGIIN
jgi:hypothetical protein